MERNVAWTTWSGEGIERLTVAWDGERVLASAIVEGVENGTSFGVRYEILCDERWRVRRLSVQPLDGGEALELLADGQGRWTTGTGDPLPGLDGCIDADISATPFTNTLPIRRLGLRTGGSANLEVAYVTIPGLNVEPDGQRYACLNEGELYRYESLESDFVADLRVDADGLVLDYPGLFRRVPPG